MTDETLGLSPMVVALSSGPTCDHELTAKVSMKQKRIFLVIPGRIFRDCVHHLLQAPNQVAVGQISAGHGGAGQIVVGGCDTLDQFDELRDALDPPDLVIVAVGDHATEGLASIRALRPRLPSTRWIMLSRHGSLNAVYDALELDVEGMLLEDTAGEVLQLVTSLVLLGQSFIPAELAKLVYHAKRPEGTSLSRTPGERTSGEKALGESLRRDPLRRAADHSLLATPPGSSTLWEREEIRFRRDQATKSGMLRNRCQGSLSDREQQILECLAKGQSNKLIARHLQIAEATVKVHVKALLRKMQVSNRTQAALAAHQFLDVPVLRDKFAGGRGLPIPSGADRGVVLPNVERLGAMGHNAAR